MLKRVAWHGQALFFFLFVFSVIAHAQDFTVLELVDGSIVRGQVTSIAAGTYTIDTDSLGTLRIPKDKIRTIEIGSRLDRKQMPTRAQVPGDLFGQIYATRQRILNDPAVLDSLLSLQDDPAFKEALNDPATLAAVQAGDIGALLKNPKFLRLLDSQKLHEIEKKVVQ